jgi:hypothetical protein
MQIARRIWTAAVCALGVLAIANAAQAQATKLLPNDTELVATVNLKQILKSDVAQGNKLIVDLVKGKVSDMLEEKGFDKWLNKAGFDVFRDLATMTVAVPTRGQGELFIVLEGKFDSDKIEAAAREASKEAGIELKIIKIADVNTFELTQKDEKTMYVGILGKKTMIACVAKSDFETAVARFNGNKTANFKSDLVKNLLSTVNDKQSISVVATSEILAKLSENNPNAGNPQAKAALDGLKKMDAFRVAITIQKDIDFQVGVNAKDDKTAKEFANISNVGLGFAKTQLKKQVEDNAQLAPVLDVIDTIRATAQGSNLLIRGQISSESLQKLLSLLPGTN